MRTPESSDVLALWERGARRHTLDRSALLAAFARPDLPPEAIAELPLGEITTSLLGLRERSFGSRLTCHVDCERCGQRLEMALDTRSLLQLDPVESDSVRVADIAGLRVRSPSLSDLATVADESEDARGARRLLERCTLQGDATMLSDEQLRDVEEKLEVLDPNADLALIVHCASCGHDGVAQLDPGALLWDEFDARARVLLSEVHVLARAYGWSEAEILGLGAERRAAYLAMVDT